MNSQPAVNGPGDRTIDGPGDRTKGPYSARVLAAGDLLAFLAFFILGRIVHAGAGPVDWLVNIPRIGAPFLLGWAIAAPVFGAYPRAAAPSTVRFLLNSTIALLAADLIAFGVRGFLLADAVTVPFVLTAVAFTALFVIGWRLLFACLLNARAAPRWLLEGAGRD